MLVTIFKDHYNITVDELEERRSEIEDPDIISTATGIQPYLVNPGVGMSSLDYELNSYDNMV